MLVSDKRRGQDDHLIDENREHQRKNIKLIHAHPGTKQQMYRLRIEAIPWVCCLTSQQTLLIQTIP